jgi:peptidoglycan/xylan/chitin deacetylase (PgdA/CDA1 family)
MPDSNTSAAQFVGPSRNFVGYGRTPPTGTWPGGAAVAVNIVVSYEEGSEPSIPDGDGHNERWGTSPVTAPSVRDLGTESRFEYGSRAGIWRLARIIDRADVPVTVAATAVALARNPAVASWICERGHDLLGHGFRWAEPSNLSRDQEREALGAALGEYQRVAGTMPNGWVSRSFASVNTRELLVEAGFVYDSDPCNDDTPYWAEVNGSSLLVVPGSTGIDDASAFERALDELLLDAQEDGVLRMLTVLVQARTSGLPARAHELRTVIDIAGSTPGAVLMRRDDIASWFIAHHPS